ncbi:MAG: DUF3147 family protein [Myxococcales bacterium]|nr:DUF3147 family protein [Myxococcales bacterium]
MLAELIVRFLLGGAIVSAFSVLGELFKPKTFAGIFGAAPSVALASLALSYAKEGPEQAAVLARSMLLGAIAFYVYGAACVATTKRERWPVWAAAAGSWVAWFAVALTLWGAGQATGVLR